jgi:hypothetical protein
MAMTEATPLATSGLDPVTELDVLATRVGALRLQQFLLRAADVGREHDLFAPLAWLLASANAAQIFKPSTSELKP